MEKVSLEDVRLAVLGVSERVCIGVPDKDGLSFKETKDVTSDFMKAVVDKFCGFGTLPASEDAELKAWPSALPVRYDKFRRMIIDANGVDRCLVAPAHSDVVGESIADAVNARADSAELAALREQRQWVPCADRLPETTGEYLVCLTGNAIRNALFENGEWADPDFAVTYADNSEAEVTAWMPLPEPFQEGEL